MGEKCVLYEGRCACGCVHAGNGGRHSRRSCAAAHSFLVPPPFFGWRALASMLLCPAGFNIFKRYFGFVEVDDVFFLLVGFGDDGASLDEHKRFLPSIFILQQRGNFKQWLQEVGRV